MIASAWLAVAAAIMLVPAPPTLPRRLGALAGAGRLVPADHRLSGGRFAWPAVDSTAAVASAAVLAGLVALTRGVAVAVAAMVAAATAGHVVRASVARRRAAAERDELIAALRLLVAELEAGSRPGAALRAVAATSARHADQLSALARAVESGSGWPNAAASTSVVGRLTQAWRVSERSGAPVADVVSRIVADLDDTRDRDRQVAAALAGPRSSATLLAGLPMVGLGLGMAMGADPVHVLLDTTPGRVVGAVGAVLDALGVVWTMRIAAAAERA